MFTKPPILRTKNWGQNTTRRFTLTNAYTNQITKVADEDLRTKNCKQICASNKYRTKVGPGASNHRCPHAPLSLSAATSLQAPRSPHTPTLPGSMSHVIAHKFAKTFKVSTCDLCKKQMIYGKW